MKANLKKSTVTRVVSCSIGAVVVVGALLLSGIAELPAQSGIMAKIFMFFLSAVIVVQVVPGLMLLAAMFKGVYSTFGKLAKVSVDNRK